MFQNDKMPDKLSNPQHGVDERGRCVVKVELCFKIS